MFKKILVPIDGSERGYEALKLACEVSKKFDSEIHILSVYRHHSLMESSISMVRGGVEFENLEDILGSYAQELVEVGKKIAIDSGLTKVKGFTRCGQIAKQILNIAKKNENDLIVIGKQGTGDLSGYLLGGTSHKISGLAKVPVLVV